MYQASPGLPRSISDLREAISIKTPPNTKFIGQAHAHDAQLTKPPGALGMLEDIAVWLSAWQNRHPPKLENIKICIFAANHGVTRHPVSAFPSDVTAQMVANFANGGAAINQLAKSCAAKLQVYDAGVDAPTGDITAENAMTEAEFIEAFGLGWQSLSGDEDLLAVGEMGIGNTTIAAALCHAVFGGSAMDWTGPGTGVKGEALAAKAQLIAKSVHFHQQSLADPIQTMMALSGKELVAIAGAVTRARHRHIPVILDGYITTAAIAPIAAVNSEFTNHCWPGHCSAEPAHRMLLEKLGLPSPILDLGLRLGEGSGAALAINIVKAAAACHNGMATFASAGVSNAT